MSLPPALAVAAEQPIFCRSCGGSVRAPGAEELIFNSQEACPTCGGTRLSAAARATRLRGISLDQACQMPLSRLMEWMTGVPASLPEEMHPMAESICQSFQTVAKRLMDLGLGYLTLGEETPGLSGGEAGGCLVAAGMLEEIAGNPNSVTGQYLI